MQFFVKLLLSIVIISAATQVGKRIPTLGGLIATMPLTGFIVLIWLYTDDPDNYSLLVSYTKGALWGVIPSILFFVAAYFSFQKQFPLSVALSIGLGVWFAGACVHQWLLK
jgi:F0F1-type ATP synthase assembly protein I